MRAEFFHLSDDDWQTMLKARAFGNALFPAVPTDTTTPIGAAENAGDIRTKDISTFLFPNAYRYSGSLCCMLVITRMTLSLAAHRMAGRNDAMC